MANARFSRSHKATAAVFIFMILACGNPGGSDGTGDSPTGTEKDPFRGKKIDGRCGIVSAYAVDDQNRLLQCYRDDGTMTPKWHDTGQKFKP